MPRCLVALFLTFSLVSCTIMPPQADFGAYPAGYQQKIPAMMATRLDHPEGARYTFEKPEKQWTTPLFKPGAVDWAGYDVIFHVAERNSRGGYHSDQDWHFQIRNGVVTNLETYSPPPTD